MDIKHNGNVRFYSGDITPEENVVFVFGGNPEGRHGAGAARIPTGRASTAIPASRSASPG